MKNVLRGLNSGEKTPHTRDELALIDFFERTIDSETFGQERIDVDGCWLRNCTFDRTVLVYSGGKPFLVTGNVGSPGIQFEGAAIRTLDALKTLHQFGQHAFVEMIIDSIRNPLGGGVN